MTVADILKQDIAQSIRDNGYPKFDATLYSKVNNPDYGIMLVPGAKRAEQTFYVENGLKMPYKARSHEESPDYPRATIRMPREQFLDLQEQMVKQDVYTFNLIVNKAIETALKVWGQT